MSAVASVLSVVLFLAFVSAGLQKVRFNPLMSATASRLGSTKRGYQRIGVVEIVAALGLLVGLGHRSSSFWVLPSEFAAVGLVIMMTLAVSVHLRSGDRPRSAVPALSLGVLALAELVVRWAS